MLCLRTHALIVEDDQDIGEPDGSAPLQVVIPLDFSKNLSFVNLC